MIFDPLFVDLYAGDGKKNWSAFVGAGAPWYGAILKATQGTYYAPDWFLTERKSLLAAATRSGRLGVDFFEGAYHYLDFANDGRRQADFCMRLVERAGGERFGTLPLMVDVERGGQSIKNPTRAQVVDCTSAFAERYHEITGRRATLYGGELLRAVDVGGLMGCGRSVVALYGAELHGRNESTAQFLARTGTSLDKLLMWQYCGDGSAALRNGQGVPYPATAPGCGKIDISVLTIPRGLAAVRELMIKSDDTRPLPRAPISG